MLLMETFGLCWPMQTPLIFLCKEISPDAGWPNLYTPSWPFFGVAQTLKTLLNTVTEETFAGKKFRTFPSKTIRMEFNFILLEWPMKVKKKEETIKMPASQVEENFVWKLISYLFKYTKASRINSLSKFLHLPLSNFYQLLFPDKRWKCK